MFFLSKKELFDNRLLRPFVKGLGGIPVDRGHADIAAVRSALKVLKEGYGLGIFPRARAAATIPPRPCSTARL